ncbi:MAG: TolC family protein [Candidatus Omnitrophica bacterium]|nr:TolC family protein [Candidatus Omnitrophota bacterium]
MSVRSFFLIFAIVLGGLTTASWAADEAAGPATLTLDSFAQKVLLHYPALKVAHGSVDVALARQMQARSGFWPSVGLSAGYRISEDPVDVFGMLLRQERFTSGDFDLKRLNTPSRHQDLSAGVHAEWPLFDAMQTIGRAKEARAGLKAAEAEEEFTRMEALLVAQDAYLNALVLEKLARIVDDVRLASEKDLKQAQTLKDKGMVPGADYYAARVMAGDFSRMHNELERNRQAMNALLNILMGEPLERQWQLSAVGSELAAPKEDANWLLETALVGRPDMIALQHRIQAAQEGSSREKATRLPKVGAFGSVDQDRDRLGSSGGNNYTVGLKAELPIFDAGRSGRLKEAQANQERLEHSVEVLKDAIRGDISSELARQGALQDNLSVLKGMSGDAAQAVSLVLPLYNEGRKSIADLMEIRRAWLMAAEASEQALSGLQRSQARLLFLTGRLNEQELHNLMEGAGQ